MPKRLQRIENEAEVKNRKGKGRAASFKLVKTTVFIMPRHGNDDMNVLVTGASGDIGREIVIAFARAGHKVALQGNKNIEIAEKISQELNLLGFNTGVYKADVSCEKEVDSLLEKIKNDFGTIDILINNAGISEIKLFDEISSSGWDNMMNVNLKSAFLLSNKCVKAMIRNKKGVIVNISSMWGQVGASCEVHYSAAKAGMIGMTKALAKELGPSGIRVNCICPGIIDTKMNSHLTDDEIREITDEIPLGRMGKAEEIAELSLFLAEKGQYITGQIIGINGGLII